MNLEKILEASKVIGWLSEQAASLGEDAENGVEMALALLSAQSYLTEYASHVGKGAEPYDALLATAKGELLLTQQQRDVLRALMPPANG